MSSQGISVVGDMQPVLELVSTLAMGFQRMQSRQDREVEPTDTSILLKQMFTMADSLLKSVLASIKDMVRLNEQSALIMQERIAYEEWSRITMQEYAEGKVSHTPPPPHPQSDLSSTSSSCAARYPPVPPLLTRKFW